MEEEKEIIYIKNEPYFRKNPNKDMWVRLTTEAENQKTDPAPTEPFQQEDSRVKIPKQPKHGPFGRG